MGVSIRSNIGSLKAQRTLLDTTDSLSRGMERLSSGLRINRASDDAAGLAISAGLERDTRVFTAGMKNINDGLSMLNIAEGALRELSSISIRQQELAEQSANGVYSNNQRSALQAEFSALTKEYNRIVESTSFNGLSLLSNTRDGVRIQAGYGVEGSILVSYGSVLERMKGDGTFKVGVSTSVPAAPIESGIADLNGDGFADIFVGGETSAQIGVILSNGDGTFKAPTTLGGGTPFMRSAIAVDVNGDGSLDLVSVSRPDNVMSSIDVFLNNGNGTFKAATSIAIGFDMGPITVTSADVNGDGRADLAISTADSTIGQFDRSIALLIGNGNGTFKAAVTYGGLGVSHGARFTDFNGDGILDILNSETTSETIEVFIGNGDGTFRAQISSRVSTEARAVDVADFNGDGLLDVVAADRVAGTLSILIGNGDGTFKERVSIAAGAFPRASRVGDFNGDGIADIGYASEGTNSFNILLGNGDGTFKGRVSYALAGDVRFISIGDVSGDGIQDIVASDYTGSIRIALGNGDTSSTMASLDISNQASARVALTRSGRTRDNISAALGSIGAMQSRLRVAASNLSTMREAYTASNSRIRDLDMAQEAGELVRNQIKQQAGASVLAQANLQPQIVLSLLRR